MLLVSHVGDFLLSVLLSPTFWTAIGAVGTVIALIFIYQQIRHARNVAAYEFLRREDDRYRTEEMKKNCSDLAIVLLRYPNDLHQIDIFADVLLDYFEDLGIILRNGLSPIYFIWSMNCHYVLRYWHILQPYIMWTRVEYQDNTYFSDFEYLYKKVAKFELRKTGKSKIEFSDRDIRQFLKEELNVKIRNFKTSDIKAILRIEKASFTIDKYPETQFMELHKNHPDSFFVAELFDDLIGYGIAYVSEDKGEFDSIAIDPCYLRLGIGSLLAQRLISYLQQHGITKYSLEVRTTNVGAVKFYEKLGFKIVKTEEHYYSDKGDAYVMEMSIVSDKQPANC